MLKRFATFLVIVAILIATPLSLSSAARNQASRIVAPLSTFLVGQNIRVKNFFSSISQISSLRDERQQLQQEVVTLQQKLAEEKRVEDENVTLRKELGVTGVTLTLKKVMAHTIIQGSDPLDRTFTIDVGSQQGIVVGQPAVSQGFLIGRVISVRNNSAVVRSILSKESRIQAWTADSREKGLLIGDGNSVFLADINQGVTITPGNVVETDGLGGSLPQGILIGQIDRLESKQSESSQTFRLKLIQDPSTIDTLFILLSDGQ